MNLWERAQMVDGFRKGPSRVDPCLDNIKYEEIVLLGHGTVPSVELGGFSKAFGDERRGEQRAMQQDSEPELREF